MYLVSCKASLVQTERAIARISTEYLGSDRKDWLISLEMLRTARLKGFIPGEPAPESTKK